MMPEHFPGTDEHVPALMSAEEACRFLRLDVGRDLEAGLRSLRRLVERGQLRPCRLTKSNCFSRSECIRLIETRTEQYADTCA